MAPAMSMRCITVPPRMNPSGFASFGSTTWTISVSDSDARFACTAGTSFAEPVGMRRLAIIVAFAALAAAVPGTASVTVHNSDELQRALDEAKPGETILLQPGATFTGNFVLPARASDDARVITVRTAGDASTPEGEAITPDAAAPLAKLRSPNGSPALSTKPGARGWRIALIEFQANRGGSGEIIPLGDGSAARRPRWPAALPFCRSNISTCTAIPAAARSAAPR